MTVKTLDTIEIVSESNFLFDTNIWFELLAACFESRDEITGKVSKLLEKILEAEATIHIPSAVMSELFNRYLRNEYEKNALINGGLDKYHYKRDFRGSNVGKEKQHFFIHQMLNFLEEFGVEKVSDNFAEIETRNILELERKKYDFNDSLLVRICEINSYTFVTNDKDFRSYEDLDFTVLHVK